MAYFEPRMYRTVNAGRGVHPPKPMMHNAWSPYFQKFINFHLFSQNVFISHYFRSIYMFCLIYVLFTSPYFDHDAPCFTRIGRP